MSYTVPNYSRRPVIQQTWGNTLVDAIERERLFQHEKKLLDQEFEYKKARDLVMDERWNKTFDLQEAESETQQEIWEQHANRMGKQNEMLQVQLDDEINKRKQNEALNSLMTQEAQNVLKEKKDKDDFAKLKQKSASWFGLGDAMDIYDERRESGRRHDLGEGWNQMMDAFDWLRGGTKDIDPSEMARDYQSRQPGYESPAEQRGNIIDQFGNINESNFGQFTGVPWNVYNPVQMMPNRWALPYVNQFLPQANMPTGSPQGNMM